MTIGAVASGALDKTVNGLVRVPALMINITTVQLVAELALRTLSAVWTGLFGNPQHGTWTSNMAETIRNSGIRPYGQLSGGQYQMSTSDLIVKTATYAVLGIVAFECSRLLCGNVPPIYNKVLSALGPFRLDNSPYFA